MWRQVLTATSTLLPIIAYPFLPSASCGETYCLIVVINNLTFHLPNTLIYFNSLDHIDGDVSSFLPDFHWVLPALSWIGYPLAHLKWHTELHGGRVHRHNEKFDEAADFAVWVAMLMVYLLCEAGLGLGQTSPHQNNPYDISQQQFLSVSRLFLAIGISLSWMVLSRGHERWMKRLIADWLWRFTTRKVYFRRWWFPKAKEDWQYYYLGEEESGEERLGSYVERMWSKRVHKWLWISVCVLVVLQLATLILVFT